MRKVLSFCQLILFGMAAAGCNAPPPSVYQGYAEGEFVLVASPYAGALESLQVSRGQEVAAAAPLFSLEQGNETAGRREAEERLRVAQAKLDNLRKGSALRNWRRARPKPSRRRRHGNSPRRNCSATNACSPTVSSRLRALTKRGPI